jgi:hypothetical protein
MDPERIRIQQQPGSGTSEFESETLQKAQEPVRYGEKLYLEEYELGTAVRYGTVFGLMDTVPVHIYECCSAG